MSDETPVLRGTSKVRVLIVEDDAVDAELIIEQLGNEGLNIEASVVAVESDFRRALDGFDPDIVLCDLTLPGFSGYHALALLRERDRRRPFVFVSGTMGEAAAIDALRAGATDYVLKNNLARLGSVVNRALGEAEERRARDIVEAELVRAQRFETLALLTGTLSHDLRNTLQPVLLATQLIEAKAGNAEVARLTGMIRDCCSQGLELVSAMLDLARGGATAGNGKRRRVKLAALLDAVGMLLRPSIPRGVDLIINPVDPALEVPGSTTDFQQCLINLVLNAIQAMPGGGRIELAARRRRLAAEFYRDGEPAIEGACLYLSVIDSGIGMSPETLAKLFTPFFTTKEGGNGLGLVSCRRFVEMHHGFIRVRSSEGAGSRFDLFLPLPDDSDGEPAEAAESEPAQDEQPDRRVAVISDDAVLAGEVHEILQLDAYQPVLSGQGFDPDRIDGVLAVVVDLATDRGEIERLLGQLRSRGDSPAVIAVGTPASPADAALSADFVASVDKPVTARALLRALADLHRR